jgi:WD40 repeat protein
MTGRSSLLILLALVPPSFAPAQSRHVDRAGDPLPDGAILRLGTMRWRAGAPIVLAAYLDDQTILTVTQDHVAQIWDASGRAIRSFDVGGTTPRSERGTSVLTVSQVALSGDGKRLAAQGCDDRLRVWNVANGSEQGAIEFLVSSSSRMAISNDGSHVAILNSNRLLGVWDVSREKHIRWLQPDATTLNQIAYRMEFARDGKHLLLTGLDTGGDLAAVARRWDTEKGTVETVPLPSEVTNTVVARAILSPDLSLLAGPNGNTVVVADLKTGKLLHQFVNATIDSRTRFGFSHDGRRLIAMTALDEVVSVFDLPSKKLVARHGVPSADVGRNAVINSRYLPPLSFSPDDKTLLAPQDAALLLIDLETGEARNQADSHAAAVRSASFDSAGKFVLTRGGDFTVRDWDARTGEPRGRLIVHGRNFGYVNSPDGRWLALTDRSANVRILDAFSGVEQLAFTADTGGWGNVVVFSPDSSTLAHVGRGAPIVTLYEISTGQKRAELRLPESPSSDMGYSRPPSLARNYPRRLWFSADSRLIAVASGGNVSVWDCTSGHQIGLIRTGDTDGPLSLALAADGHSLATESATGELAVWEIATGGKRFILTKESSPARDRINSRITFDPLGYATPMAFAPDGRLLALAQADYSVRLWDVAKRRETASFKGHHGQVVCVTFSADGERLLSGSTDTTALIWDVHAVRERLTADRAKLEPSRAEGLWAKLLDPKADSGVEGIDAFAGDAEFAVTFLRKQIKPAEGPEPAHIAKLISDLDVSRYAVREHAANELTRLGELAASALREAAQTSRSAEVRKQARQLLDGMVYEAPTGERLRMLRALEVLERVATPGAVALLKELAGGSPATIPTLEARAALHRLMSDIK